MIESMSLSSPLPYGELAGIIQRPASPHRLRHASATKHKDIGTDIRAIQELLGHAEVTTTQRYVHVDAPELRAAVDELGAEWKRAVRERKRRKKGGRTSGTRAAENRV